MSTWKVYGKSLHHKEKLQAANVCISVPDPVVWKELCFLAPIGSYKLIHFFPFCFVLSSHQPGYVVMWSHKGSSGPSMVTSEMVSRPVVYAGCRTPKTPSGMKFLGSAVCRKVPSGMGHNQASHFRLSSDASDNPLSMLVAEPLRLPVV